jgi:hypothetical protein
MLQNHNINENIILCRSCGKILGIKKEPTFAPEDCHGCGSALLSILENVGMHQSKDMYV